MISGKYIDWWYLGMTCQSYWVGFSYCFSALSTSLDLFVFCCLKFGLWTLWKHNIAHISLFHVCMHFSCGPWAAFLVKIVVIHTMLPNTANLFNAFNYKFLFWLFITLWIFMLGVCLCFNFFWKVSAKMVVLFPRKKIMKKTLFCQC